VSYTFGETLLEAKNVSLVLDGKKILHDVNIDIKDIIVPNRTTGQIIGLCAPSGRGKTQLFKLLAGINAPTTGQVLVRGKIVTEGSVGVVSQDYRLFEHHSILRNLELGFHDKNTKAEHDEKIKYYLDRFKLTEHSGKYPAQLSGGQRQRIAIIQQILCSEHFILMDEPFSGLDPVMTYEMCSLIEEVADMDELNTIIVVSHDATSIASISNLIWLLGYDYDDQGNPLKDNGSTIKYVENLMDMGFCWREDRSELMASKDFLEFVIKIKNAFKTL
jgi:ABC-type nitrate/sulfonate/bicarbonate transport system ATPase subunit